MKKISNQAMLITYADSLCGVYARWRRPSKTISRAPYPAVPPLLGRLADIVPLIRFDAFAYLAKRPGTRALGLGFRTPHADAARTVHGPD
jgi:hypothetical protein